MGIRTTIWTGIVSALIVTLSTAGGVARGDLAQEFEGFQAVVMEQGVSGLGSSYHSDTQSGNVLPDHLPVLSGQRVCYPYDVGAVPSPGDHAVYIARHFDEGAMGVKIEGDNLIVRVAGGLNPKAGYYYRRWRTWFGQGDVFIAVGDTSGISHFALMNDWPRSSTGSSLRLGGGGGVFDAARAFHTRGGAGGTSLGGHLVSLTSNEDVALTDGPGSYSPASSDVAGLDHRVYAQGGIDLGGAGVAHYSVSDVGLGGIDQTWYVQTWTFPVSWLSSDPAFAISLHKTATCGNDQIGLTAAVGGDVGGDPPVVPAPGALALGGIGLAIVLGRTRRSKRTSDGSTALVRS